MTSSGVPVGTKASFFISTPYIDAYEHDWDDPESGRGVPQITYDEFAQRMRGQAMSWGEASVGRAALSALEPALHDGRYVLAFGTHGGKKYLAVVRPDSSWETDVIEVAEIPHEWNVT